MLCWGNWLELEVFMDFPPLGSARASQVYCCSELYKQTGWRCVYVSVSVGKRPLPSDPRSPGCAGLDQLPHLVRLLHSAGLLSLGAW